MAIGGTGGTGGTGGAGGSSGAGGFDNGGGAGGTNPLGGAGGTAGMAVSGAGGAGGGAGTGNPGGMGGVGGAIGGTGGSGGAGGTAGASADPDAGMDPDAPMLECEQGRDTVMLWPGAFEAPTPSCTAELPADALGSLEMLALAVTVSEQGSPAATTWPGRIELGDACGEEEAFFVNNSLGVPQLTLCPALCEALAELGSEAFKLELIYGCDPPE